MAGVTLRHMLPSVHFCYIEVNNGNRMLMSLLIDTSFTHSLANPSPSPEQACHFRGGFAPNAIESQLDLIFLRPRLDQLLGLQLSKLVICQDMCCTQLFQPLCHFLVAWSVPDHVDRFDAQRFC